MFVQEHLTQKEFDVRIHCDLGIEVYLNEYHLSSDENKTDRQTDRQTDSSGEEKRDNRRDRAGQGRAGQGGEKRRN
jgi:hypothetical protein